MLPYLYRIMNNDTDVYYKKYLKYKRKYLELKYGGAFNIIDVIPSSLSDKLLANIYVYIDEFLSELSKNDNTGAKKYINDIKILIPILIDVGGIFITNINVLSNTLQPILNIKTDNITTTDINLIKKQLGETKKIIPQLKVNKTINPLSVANTLVSKSTQIIHDFNELKKTTLYEKIGLKNIIKPLVDKISSVPLIGNKVKKYIDL